MAWYDKYIPKEIKKPVDEFLDFGSDVIEKGITKPFASLSDKLIPNELRFLAPYAAGIGTLMLPPGMNMMTRALLASMMNAGGQIAADESATGELSDLNKLSMAIAGGLGALGSQDVTDPKTGIRSGIESGVPPEAAMARGPSELGMTTRGPGFLQGAENVGREGIASLSDYVQGTRSTLADIGKDPGSLFQKNVPGRENFLGMKKTFPVLQDAAAALTPTATLGTADLAYEAAIDAQNLFDENEAEELRQAGMDEEAISNARRAAIRSSMLAAQFTEDEILNTFDQIGLKDGGIASLKNGGIPDNEFMELVSKLREDGFSQEEAIEEAIRQLSENMAQGGIIGLKEGGMLDFGGREMDLRGGGFVPIGKKERADDVPARLSKNEFVMTADAVRAAGGGSVNKGAQRMYDIMNRLEARA
jgi:hypothetical protein